MVEGLSVRVGCGRSEVGGQQRNEEEQRRGVDNHHKEDDLCTNLTTTPVFIS